MEIIPQPFAILPPRDRFAEKLQETGLGSLGRKAITVLQINVGRLCNQTCRHCHVEAGPRRKEIMGRDVVRRMIQLAAAPAIETIDITGGAPEMNPHFRELVVGLRGLGKGVSVRCNLTILEEEGYEWVAEFFAEQTLHLICSLPCYTPQNVAQQRGEGVFEKSIRALRRLNALGYGREGPSPGLVLDLVYNPLGPTLPPSQQALEGDYKRELGENYGVRFNRLYALANLPIGRFRRTLSRRNELIPYLDRLEGAFNGETVEHLMCRNTLNVSWDGRIFDCDFNQMLDMELGAGAPTIFDPAFSLEALGAVPIATGDHCLGCTAGAGSSCGGTLT